jgi:TolB protein
MDADGGNQTFIWSTPDTIGTIVWSPDGSTLLFSCDQAGGWDLYVVGSDGPGSPALLIDSGFNDEFPDWSSDGTIAWITNEDGDYDIWLADADGTNQRELRDTPYDDGGPDWSPGGKMIAYMSRAAGPVLEIYTMRADGSDPRRLTWDQGVDDIEPAWSPDGSRIIWQQGLGPLSRIMIMNANGSDQSVLVDTPGVADFAPDW